MLLSRRLMDHRVSANGPFRLTENLLQGAITEHLLGEHAITTEVGELLVAA